MRRHPGIWESDPRRAFAAPRPHSLLFPLCRAAVGSPTPTGRAPDVSRRAKGGFLLATLLAGLALALPAQAQRDNPVLLVGNVTGTTNTSGPSVGDEFGVDSHLSQEFTTGPNADGYFLYDVELFSSHSDEEYVVRLCVGNNPRQRNNCLLLDPPDDFADTQAANASSGTVFTIPVDRPGVEGVYADGYFLEPSTLYSLFIEGTGPRDRRLHLVGDGDEDAGGQPGWLIKDTYQILTLNEWADPPSNALPLKVKINGAVVTEPPPVVENMPVIEGFPQVGNTLTASTSAITDPDGLGSPTYTYRWTRIEADGDRTVIPNSDSSTYTVVAADVGERLIVRVTFRDAASNTEMRTSAPTIEGVQAPRECRAGSVWCAELTLGGSYTTNSKGYCDVAAGRGDLGRGACKEAYGALDDTQFTLDGVNYTVESVRIGTRARHSSSASIHLTLDQDLPDDEDSLLRLSLQVGNLSPFPLNFADAVRNIPVNENVADNNYRWSSNTLRDPGSEGRRVTVDLVQGPHPAPIFGLVGNAGQAADADNPAAPASGASLSQEFTTGPHTHGYTLESIETFDDQTFSSGGAMAYALSVCGVDGSGNPDRDACTPLAHPADDFSPNEPADTAGRAFTAPAGMVLSANTTYSLLLVVSAENVMLDTVAGGAEDRNGAAGWSLADSYQALSGSTWSNAAPARPLKTRVNGRVRDLSASTPATDDHRADVYGLVGNSEQDADTANPAAPAPGARLSQEFTTGPHTGGYVLESIETFDDQTVIAYSLSVCGLDGDGDPDQQAPCTALVTPTDDFPPSEPTDTTGRFFTAPAGTVLSADTTYSLLLVASAGNIMLDTVAGGAEDANAATGWSLADSYQTLSGSTWSDATPARPLKTRINGRARNIVTPVPATGEATISGAAQAGNTLSVSVADLIDPNGLENSEFSYRWVQVDGADNETAIEGATEGRYTATADDVGMRLRAKVMFRDGIGTIETLSARTAVVRAAPRECGDDIGATRRSVWCATLTVGAPESDAFEHGYCDPAAGEVLCTSVFGSLSEPQFVLDGQTYTVESLRWNVDARSFPANQTLLGDLHLTLDRDFPSASLGGLRLLVDALSTSVHSLNLADADAERTRATYPYPENDYLWEGSGRPLREYPVGLRMTVELLQTPPPAAAASALVGNVTRTPITTGPGLGAQDVFQDFVTGSTPGGYSLDSVDLFHDNAPPAVASYNVSLCPQTTDGVPDTTRCTALTPPQTLSDASENRFTAPLGTVMSPSTTYSLRIFGTGVNLHVVTGGAEDAGRAPGWRIANIHRVAGTGGFMDGQQPLQVRIRGTGNAPTGLPGIRGFLQVSHTLEAWTGDIADPSGLRDVVYEYQWIRVDSDAEVDIPGANSSSYRLTPLDEGKNIRLRVSFRDDHGNREELTSMPTEDAVLPGPGACSPENIWCATLTLGTLSTQPAIVFRDGVATIVEQPLGASEDRGYCDPAVGTHTCDRRYGALSNAEFALRGVDYAVESLRWTGDPSEILLDLDRDFDAGIQSRLTLMVGSRAFALDNAARATATTTGPTENYYRWTPVPDELVSFPLEMNVTVQAILAPSQPPAFDNAALTRAVPENSGGGASVGAAIPAATDPEGDAVTYAMAGPDAASFGFNASTRQIVTAAGAGYDYETRASYTVTIRATDGEGGVGETEVTINITNVSEPPAAPVAPIVASANSLDSIDVEWTAPANPGPPITDYDVRYCLGEPTDCATDGDFADHPFAGTGTSTTIPGLTSSATYQVQVRASNGDGVGQWSASGSGMTNSPGNTSPQFATTLLTRSVDEGAPVGTHVGEVPEATDAEGAELTYEMMGADAASFAFDAAARRISTTTGVDYDYETKSSYTVKIRADDGEGGAGLVTVNILLNNVLEASVRVDLSVRRGQVSEGESNPQPVEVMGTLDGLPTGQDVTVDLDIARSDDYAASGATLTIAAGETEGMATIMVTVIDDQVDEMEERVPLTGTITQGTLAVAVRDGFEFTIRDNDTRGVTVTPTELHVREGESATYAVALLSEPDGSQVGGQMGGQVVVRPTGTGRLAQVAFPPLTFTTRNWMTPQTVTVTMPEDGDATSDAPATVTHAVRGADYGDGAVTVATVTVVVRNVETTEVQEGWLARFGRTVATQAVDAIGARLSRSQAPQAQLNLGGATPQAALLSGALKMLSGETAVDARQALTNSSFVLPLAGDGGDMWTAWGRGAHTDFEGKENDTDLDGEVTTGTIGVDFARGDWLTGVALSHSEGDGDSRGLRDERGEMDISLTSVSPYAKVDMGDGVGVWGMAGFGEGDLERSSDGGAKTEVDLDMQMVAAGVEGPVGSIATDAGSFDLKLKADAMTVRMEADAEMEMPDLEADAQRFRLLLSGAGNYPSESGDRVAPTLEAGVRWDEGDAETGLGIEVGAGLHFADANGRFHTELKARGLVAHEESDYDEWGVSGTLAVGPEGNGRGLTLKLESGYGATESGTRALWTRRDLAGLTPDGPAVPTARMGLELGYGLNGPAGRGTWTPYLGYQDGTVSELRLGTRLDLGEALSLEFAALRRDEEFGEMAIRLQGRW